MGCRVELWPDAVLPPPSDWLPVLLYAALFFLVLIIGELYRRVACFPDAFTRTYTQLVTGVLLAALPCFFTTITGVVSLAGLCTLIFGVCQRLRVPGFTLVLRLHSRRAWLFPLFPIAVLYLSEGGGVLYSIPVLVSAVTHALGPIMGQSLGRLPVHLYDQTRTLEGMIAFGILIFLVVHIPLLLSGQVGDEESLLIALLSAVMVVGLEAISARGLDFVLVPGAFLFALQRMLGFALDSLIWRTFGLLVMLLVAVATFRSKRATFTSLFGVLLLAYATMTLGGLTWLVPLLVFLFTYNLGVPEHLNPVPANAVASHEMGGDLNDIQRVWHFLAVPASLLFA